MGVWGREKEGVAKSYRKRGFGGIGNSRAHGVALMHRATGSPSKEAWAFLDEKGWRRLGGESWDLVLKAPELL